MMNDHTPETISAFTRQFQQIRILLTAYELDIFTCIGTSAMTSEQVAKLSRSDVRATDRFLNALCVMGFLDKEDNHFSNTPASRRYLVKGEPGYMSGLMHQVHLWDTWTTLTECIRKGTSVFDRPENVNDRDPSYLEAFIGAMHYRARDNALESIGRINLEKSHRILDVGGGSGVFAMAFVRAGEGLTATVFDLPNVIPITRKYILDEGMEGKINTVEGDYNADPLPTGYDIVFLSAIIHANSYLENQELVRKCAASLNPGGRIIIKDQVMKDSRIEPASGALFALNMLVNTRAGDTYTEKEIKEWFDHAGIRFVETIATPGTDSMVIGRKG
jgi:2-polyprenyl-3-methyl-5-hydroxy-6-metoxy-1,4-benzoquinol methylase